MSTRKVKDAKDLSTNELIYFKGHAKATYMSDGRNVEEAINQIGTGGGGGGGEGGSISESDIAAMGFTKNRGTITEVKMNGESKGTDGVVELNDVITSQKYTSRQVDACLDKITSGDIAPYYLMFRMEDLYRMVQSDLNAIKINVQDIIEAFEKKRPMRVFVISNEDEVPGYYTAAGYIEDFIYINIFDGRSVFALEIPLDATEITKDNLYFHDLSMSPSTGGTEPYITGFTWFDLFNLSRGDLDRVQADKTRLLDAITNHRTCFVPYGDSIETGWGLLTGYCEDLLYLTVYDADGNQFYVETSFDDESIYSSQVQYRPTLFTEKQGDLNAVISVSGFAANNALVYAFPNTATGDEDDVLLSRGTVKTINGQTIMRDGDSDDIITTYERIITNLSSVELLPNSVTEWALPIRSQELVLTFGEQPLQGHVSEYIARFSVGADGVQLIVPDSVVWADGVYPAMTAGKTYEISIVDNLATFLEF